MTRLQPILSLALFCIACGPRAATIVDDREVYVETITDTICAEKMDCGEIGEDDSEYATMEECSADVEAFMRDWWSEDECLDDRINGDKFLECDDRARLGACDGGLSEQITLASECNQSEVCID